MAKKTKSNIEDKRKKKKTFKENKNLIIGISLLDSGIKNHNNVKQRKKQLPRTREKRFIYTATEEKTKDRLP